MENIEQRYASMENVNVKYFTRQKKQKSKERNGKEL
jgi:hypothetical protein